MSKPKIISLEEARVLLTTQDCSSFSTGGHLKDLPKPYLRYYEYTEKCRRVTVTMQRFSLGLHYYITIREAPNYILDRRLDEQGQITWRRCWYDKSCDGNTFYESFDSESDAAHYVLRMWKENFSDKTHILYIEDAKLENRINLINKIRAKEV